MKWSLTFLSLFIFLVVPKISFADTCSYSSDHPYKLLVDYLDSKVNYVACEQKVYSDDGLCTSTQKYQTDFYDKGQFSDELNQRNQEVVYALAFLYEEPCSGYHDNVYLLNRVLFGLDYLCRSQGDAGGITEDGWKGVDYTDADCDGDENERSVKDGSTSCDSSDCTNVGNCTSGDDASTMCNSSYFRCDPEDGSATSVSGFTYYAAAQAIHLLYDDSNFQTRLMDSIVGGGDGVADDPRSEAYARLVTKAASFLTGSGRGHAPNQDVWALLALHALNEAYSNLESLGYSTPDSSLDSLMDDLDSGTLDDLRDEIFFGTPDEAIDGNGFNRWFTGQGLLLEKGYKATAVDEENSHSAGYDGNYSWVTLRGLSLLRDWDSAIESSGFLDDYINWFQYFFYVDLDFEKGGYQISAIARRQWQDGDIKLPISGILQDMDAMHTLYNSTLEHFMADPANYFTASGSELFKGSLYTVGDFLLKWTEPTASTYLLPLNRLDDGNGSDFSDYTDTQADQDGASVVLLDISNTNNTPEGVRYYVNDWWDGQKEYYYGASTATITIDGPTDAQCTLYGISMPYDCYLRVPTSPLPSKP